MAARSAETTAVLAPLLALAAAWSGVAAAQSLTVCMAENNPPLSYRVDGEVRGLDVLVAQAVANELKLSLRIVPFESKYEADKTLAHEVNALLSSGVCELASGFPLIAGDLGPPSRATARVPDYPGARRPPQRDWVPLTPLAPSAAYHAVGFGLVVREAARTTATLAEPGDARIGATAGTLTGTLVTLYRNGKLRPQLVSLSQNEDALEQLALGRIDAAVVSMDRFDAWRISHPGTDLRRAAYMHPMRINIGFVARADARELLGAADRVIARSLADGQLERWSAATGTTWIAPADPQVSGPIGIAELMRE